MKTSTQTDLIANRIGLENTLRLYKEAGFDCYDLSLFDMLKDDCVFNSPAYLDKAKRIRAFADSLGLPCNQAHAPFPSSKTDIPENAEFNAVIIERIVRAMEIASVLGAKAIVVHPKHEVFYLQNQSALKEKNVAFYRSLEPYAKKFGIKVAVENMWQRNPIGGHIVDSACARPEDFIEMMDALNPEYFVACLDIGHAVLCSHDPADFIRALGHNRLHALHVHDVDGIADLHTMPFLEKVDFLSVADALKEIDYDGEITLEANNFYRNMPAEVYPEAVRMMAAAARFIANRASN